MIQFDLQLFQYFDNATPNKTVTGTNDSDSIKNSGALVKIYAQGGSDTIDNSANLVTISGGADSDKVTNSGSNVRISLDAGDDYAYNNSGTDIKIYGGAGSDTVYNSARKVSIYGGADNDSIRNYGGDSVFVDGGAGDDTIENDYGGSSNVTINAGAGNDSVYSYGMNTSISGGAGDDTIMSSRVYSSSDYSKIAGNAGSDIVSISTSGYAAALVQYTYGDGDDTVFGFNSTDTLQITTPKKFTTMTGGNDLYFIFDTGSITLKDVTTANVVTIKGGSTDDGDSDTDSDGGDSDSDSDGGDSDSDNTWKISGTKATHGDITLTGIKKGSTSDGIKLKGKSVTLTSGVIGSSGVSVKGAGYSYTLGGKGKLVNIGGAATLNGSSKNDTLVGGSGKDTLIGEKGNDILSGGAGADIFVYGVSTGNDVITDYTAADKIKISANSIDNYISDATLSGDSDIILKVGTGSIKIKNGLGKEITFLNKNNKSTIMTYGEDDGGSDAGIIFKKKVVTLTEDYESESFSLAGEYKSALTVDASAVVHSINITGNNSSNKIIGTENDDYLDGGKGRDTIYGGDGNDTIIGGKGNDILYGDEGDDIFVYKKGDGNDKIFDYAEGDVIRISGDSVSEIDKSDENVIFTLGSANKITVAGASDEIITYAIGGKTNTFLADVGKYVTFNKKGTSAKLKSAYPTSSFMPVNYSDYQNSLVTIDGSAVAHDLNIIGNDNKNSIRGGSQNDTIDGDRGNDKIFGGDGSDSIFGGIGDDELHGGKGKDTLWGGAGDDELYGDDGKDVFYYNTGEGNDTIFGYEATVDKIILASGTISNVTTDRNNNVIFSVGDGQIVVNNCADRTVKIVNSSGNIVKNGLYEP